MIRKYRIKPKPMIKSQSLTIIIWYTDICIVTNSFGYVNKAILPINFKAVVSHIIEKFDDDVEFVIAVGHKKNSIIDYIYPFIKKFNKTIIVSGYKSKLIEKKFKNNKKILFAFNKK